MPYGGDYLIATWLQQMAGYRFSGLTWPFLIPGATPSTAP